ncbi:MAG: hypothetical protein UR12_C0043G0017 [candidate division TM6 bacterium GW2011_GWF2_30_66]|nr:MAG: hypothetical protein UR12_C0043G0017 [candidate division TM6 bacterium GW2011_GWF2_30_66]
MMKIDMLKNLNEKRFERKLFEVFDSLGDIYRSKYIRDPLSEHDILDLQEKFLTNGIHHIAVKNVMFGRSLVFKFLNSINCYHDNAVLSMSNEAVNFFCSKGETFFSDIYYDLLQDGYISKNKKTEFNDFFIEQFYYDFMFIEANQELIDSSWFLNFFDAIKNNKIDQHIPIIVISYIK